MLNWCPLHVVRCGWLFVCVWEKLAGFVLKIDIERFCDELLVVCNSKFWILSSLLVWREERGERRGKQTGELKPLKKNWEIKKLREETSTIQKFKASKKPQTAKSQRAYTYSTSKFWKRIVLKKFNIHSNKSALYFPAPVRGAWYIFSRWLSTTPTSLAT